MVVEDELSIEITDYGSDFCSWKSSPNQKAKDIGYAYVAGIFDLSCATLKPKLLTHPLNWNKEAWMYISYSSIQFIGLNYSTKRIADSISPPIAHFCDFHNLFCAQILMLSDIDFSVIEASMFL